MMSDTAFTKKPLKKAFWCVLLGVLVLLTPFFISALSSQFDDDFEFYDLGNLSGQGNWSGDVRFDVVDGSASVWEGEKGVKYNHTDTSASSEITLTTTEISQSGNRRFILHLKPQSWLSEEGTTARFFFDPTDEVRGYFQVFVARMDKTNYFKAYVYGFAFDEGGNYLEFSGQDIDDVVLKDEWLTVILEVNFDTYIAKTRFVSSIIDSEWYYHWYNSTREPLPTPITELILRVDKDKYYYSFDTLVGEGICGVGTCDACGTYEDCIEAGCFWYYSEQMYLLFGQGGSCIEPEEPSEEECGVFFKCQYCDEESCGTGETEGWCEWVDKGAGYGCYMLEPTIPPEQVVWELPELEDCEELSGVEKWLCEIKNFIAGIFMPSQEKLNDLYDTLLSFKTKFPFNYIMALDDFFKDVSENTEEEKSIPITILGAESEVNFDFWSASGEVGGETETFADTIKDFTTMVLLILFLAWLITTIKKFW